MHESRVASPKQVSSTKNGRLSPKNRNRGLSMLSRRSFMRSSAALATTAISYNRIQGANESLRVGCIGTGGRCRHLMKSLPKIPDVSIVAVCDIWEVSLTEGRKLADPQAFATRVYKELLDRN